MNPSTALFVDATQVSTAAITGAEHGAATRPDIAPIVNAPDSRPVLPTLLARSTIPDGRRTGITSNMANAAISNRFAIAR